MILVAILATGSSVWASMNFSVFSLPIDLPIGNGSVRLGLPISLLVFLVFMARPFVRIYDARHEVGCHHLHSIEGICSIARDEVEVPFIDLKGVRFHQTILERILNVGTVIVWTAFADKPEFELEDVGNPEEICGVIRDRIDTAQSRIIQESRTVQS
jgi:membrane protein YdbS with pleckstrin-like domain